MILNFLGVRIAAINFFKSILMDYEITYDTVMQSSCVGGGGAVGVSAPQKV